MSDSSNPNIQCENCGRWRRLYDAEDNQLNFPFDGKLLGYPGIYFDQLCVWCHLLFGIILKPFKEVHHD